eukprot:10428138-Alexandrium_andersonii.AAC.1
MPVKSEKAATRKDVAHLAWRALDSGCPRTTVPPVELAPKALNYALLPSPRELSACCRPSPHGHALNHLSPGCLKPMVHP